jgi:hypothetical protein
MSDEDEAALIGDSSMHRGDETAPEGGFYRHRLMIRFTNGETMTYTVREALHAEDIPADVRFVVISSYLCEKPDHCAQIVLLNLNDISYIKTEHITDTELEREETAREEAERQKGITRQPLHLSRIGFI